MSNEPPEQNEINIDASKPLGNVRVILEGLCRIGESTIFSDLRQIEHAQTVLELFSELEDSLLKLDKLGLFQKIVSNVKRGPRKGDVDVVFDFTEKTPSYTFGANTNSRAEANVGSCYIPRIIGLPRFTGRFNIFASQNDLVNYSAFSTVSKGVNFSLLDCANRHLFSWEAALQDIYPTFNETKRASATVLKNAGRSLKHSISYTFTLDELRGDGIPNDGQCTVIKTETGLPGGNSQYLKVEYSMLLARLIHEKLIMHWNLSGGYLKNFRSFTGGDDLLQKFHFTGASGCATTFKGLGYHGVGPCDFGAVYDKTSKSWQSIPEHVGGDYYANLQCALHYPVKVTPHFSPMVFGFGNLGVISNHKNMASLPKSVQGLRLSVGGGISVPVMPGCWLEATCGFPILYGPHDILQRYQLGLRFKNSAVN
ncbi:bifunctional Surface antigen D15-like/Bacterial surface antigen (D15) [Babesia duncani]|uniref:Bifunctional Surface antigen D15-like/Bacterial surface antigen (D15) n=1 Tax=Babesia duncani TaxID=323732 RepID=A0AAD9PJC7_9APIC|nr:bifunctional Surface antigen D15-like/Bacterial surface antigen (D15) [Babesia duncani]